WREFDQRMIQQRATWTAEEGAARRAIFEVVPGEGAMRAAERAGAPASESLAPPAAGGGGLAPTLESDLAQVRALFDSEQTVSLNLIQRRLKVGRARAVELRRLVIEERTAAGKTGALGLEGLDPAQVE